MLSFKDARDVARRTQWRTSEEWKSWTKAAGRPDGVPADPPGTYADEWKGWGDWLKAPPYPFEQARAIAVRLGVQSKDEWLKADLPGGLPRDPSTLPDFVCWNHWLGTGCWQSTDVCVPLGTTFTEAASKKADELDTAGKVARRSAESWGPLMNATPEQICNYKKDRKLKLDQIRLLKEFADRWTASYGADPAEHFTAQMDALTREVEDTACLLEKIEADARHIRLRHALLANADRCTQAAAAIRASINRKRPRE